jgi:hypothetical protein
MRVYIGSGLREDKKPMCCVRQLLLYLIETLFLLANLKDFIYNYLLNHLGYGPPGPFPWAKWANSW